MKLIKIQEDKYYNYRLQVMFDCYKWDPQFCDNNTLAGSFLTVNIPITKDTLENRTYEMISGRRGDKQKIFFLLIK